MTAEFQKEYVYKSTLRDVYGMTDSMIAELGDPDLRVKNPHYRSGPLASLYLIERVEAWCDAHDDRLQKALSARAKRSEASKRANETKYNQIIEWANTVTVELYPPDSYEAVWNEADAYYASRDWRFFGFGVGFGGVVAYMRHNCTNYDRLLKQIYGQVGTHEAYQIIRDRADNIVEQWLNEAQTAQEGVK